MRLALTAASVAVLASVAALAAGVSTTSALLARVPTLPHDAAAAYAQWHDDKGNLTPGASYATLESDIRNTAMVTMQATQSQAANDLARKYATPEGQAEIKAMSMEQKMALAQQMAQAQAGGNQMGTAVSESDGALIRKLTPSPSVIMVRTKLADISQRTAAIATQWDGDTAKIDAAQEADLRKLPICQSEAGEPSSLAIKGVMLKYADQRIALAATYMPKYQALTTEKRNLVAPETKFADDALAAWTALKNPMLRNQFHTSAAGAVANAAADVGLVFGIVEEGSKKAAATMARKHELETEYKDAKGC